MKKNLKNIIQIMIYPLKRNLFVPISNIQKFYWGIECEDNSNFFSNHIMTLSILMNVFLVNMTEMLKHLIILVSIWIIIMRRKMKSTYHVQRVQSATITIKKEERIKFNEGIHYKYDFSWNSHTTDCHTGNSRFGGEMLRKNF